MTLKRIKTNNGHGRQSETEQLKTYTTLMNRAQLMARLGQQYGGDRDIYQALGYSTDLDYTHYLAQYERQDIAKAIINRPVEATWRGGFTLLESKDIEETPLEKAWGVLKNDIMVMTSLSRLDRLAGIGHYGVLLLGLSDVKDSMGFSEPVAGNKLQLKYVKPLAEGSAEIVEWEQDTGNERFGLPTMYRLTVRSSSDTTAIEIDLKVHHTRIIHAQSSELLESESHGVPRLKAVFNRLKDLEKLVGGSAEMFWRGARPGYQAKLSEEYKMDEDTLAALQTQVDEYEHNIRRILINEGIDLTALQMQVADPSAHVDIQLQMISAVTGIPKRILTGSEMGELASSQDLTNWLHVVQSRREEYAEPVLVRPFIDRCIEYGVLPEPKEEDYSVEWEDLWSASAKEKAEIGEIIAKSINVYGSSPANEMIVPPNSYYKFVLGFTDEQIEQIEEEKEKAAIEEEKQMAEDEKALEEAQAALPAPVETVPPGFPQQPPKKKEEVVIK